LTLNGYGYFDTSELTWDIGIFGEKREPQRPLTRQAPLQAAEKIHHGSA
jgi:hypothetical protein